MAIREDGLRNFSFYYHNMVDNVVDYRHIYGGYQLILMEDGEVYLYDDEFQTIRKLPIDPNDMTERECRNEFGKAMQRIMHVQRVSQLVLSERTGISQASLSCYMRGTVTPSFYAADRIAKALGRPLDDFTYTGF